MDYKFTKEEYNKLGQYILFELGMEGVLSESKVKNIHASSKILQEEMADDSVYDVLEERATGELTPMKVGFDGTNITISHGFQGNERLIAVPPSTIKSVWQDPKYQTAPQILIAFGIPNDEVQMRDTGGKINNRVTAIRKVYNDRYAASTPGVSELASVGKRKDAYWSNRKNRYLDDGGDYDEPSTDQIDRGRRGRRGRRDQITDRINQQEILAGTFYRDVTRISRSNTSRWVRFWKRNLSAVQSNKKSLLGLLIGRTWKKTFLLGYQVNRTLFFEVWYNSMDSSFSVYDKNGIELTHPIPTLQESIRMLIRTIAQESPGDRDIFTSGRAGAEMASSLNRVFGQGVEKEVKQIRREDEFMQNELRRERQDRQGEVKDRKARMDSRRKPVKSSGNWPAAPTGGPINSDKVRDIMKNASSTARAAVASAAIGASTAEFEKPKHNTITSKTGQTSASIDRSQLELEDMQIRQYRQSLGHIMGRLSDEQGKLQAVNEDPFIFGDLSFDPDIAKMFSGINNPNDLKKIADQVHKAVADQKDYIARVMELSDEDFSEELRKKMREEGRDFPTSTKKMMNVAMRRLNRHRGMFESALEEEANWRPVNDRQREITHAYDQERREKEEAVQAQNAAAGFNPTQTLDDLDRDREAQRVRNGAKNSTYNKHLLISDIANAVEAYDITRIRHSTMRSTFSKWFGRLTRNRTGAIQSPLDRPNFFSRAKQAFFDQSRRADFIIGYSLNNIINIEVWYITELDPSGNGRMISSFYVYDVTAEKILRSHLPYFRNAAQVISAKIGVSQRGL